MDFTSSTNALLRKDGHRNGTVRLMRFPVTTECVEWGGAEGAGEKGSQGGHFYWQYRWCCKIRQVLILRQGNWSFGWNDIDEFMLGVGWVEKDGICSGKELPGAHMIRYTTYYITLEADTGLTLSCMCLYFWTHLTGVQPFKRFWSP